MSLPPPLGSAPENGGQVVLDVGLPREQRREALEGAASAGIDLGLAVTVVGPENEITTDLRDIAHDAEQLRVIDAPAPLSDNTAEICSKSSTYVAMALVRDDPNAAFVGAGSPAWVIRAANDLLDAVPGLGRPALAAVYPTLQLRGVRDDPFALLLDVGAGSAHDPEELLAFALMGAMYAERISENPSPRVALLSNGPHLHNAPAHIRAADALLRERADGGRYSYIGTIRADQVTLGDADVIVTDGFTGDVLIRTLEGVAATAEQLLERARSRFQWRIGMSILGAGVTRLRELANWENYGGAPLLGYERTVILTQSDAGRRAIVNAIRLAAKVRRLRIVDDIQRALLEAAPNA